MTMSQVLTKLITADELLKMGDIGRCELVYGELIMMSPAGAEDGMVVVRFGRFLDEFVAEHRLGVVFGAETGFKIHTDPDTVRAPDASFVRRDRIKGKLTRKFYPGVPDLAVEVISPDDTRREMAEKVNMWLVHGTQTVWVADPAKMAITIHRVGQKPLTRGVGDVIDDEPLLPGFVLQVSKIFQTP